MKRAVLVVSALLLAAGSGFAADAPKNAGVKSLDAAWTKAILAGDAEGLAALYADDAVLVMPGSAALRGKKAIGEAFAGMLKDLNVTEFVLMDSHYKTSGHLSAGWGRYKMTTAPKAGGAPTTETGTYCGVATEKDGVWKYVSDNAAADPAKK
ncbi:MAG TPA: nuclear transport factor 2 family protein [Thermoanaerobaculia bacterium]|nr:nuclear transport factor 2 family protein [Thermoanaerobaculia bacterium]